MGYKDRCVECDREITDNPVVVYGYGESPVKVHSGKCLEKYNQSLNGETSVQKGAIIGICIKCAKPVRTREKYSVGVFNGSETAFTKPENITLIHEGCNEEVFSC